MGRLCHPLRANAPGDYGDEYGDDDGTWDQGQNERSSFFSIKEREGDKEKYNNITNHYWINRE
jgi:hypothetical protein